MLNCLEVTRLYSEAQERDLLLSERMAVGVHVMMCKGCRRFGQQMTSIRRIAREYARKPDPAPDNGSNDNGSGKGGA